VDARSPCSLRVVDRALEILQAFSGDRPQLTLSDISRRTGLPLTTVHRLVGELARWGALERDEDNLYGIGLRLWEVAVRRPRSSLVRDAALPFLANLHEVTRETVRLSILDGADVVIIEQIADGHRTAGNARVGDRLSAHATGEGRALLAYAPSDVQEDLLSAAVAASDGETVAWPAGSRQLLAEVRRTGVAVCATALSGAASVAAPIRGRSGTAIAALSILATRRRTSLSPLVEAVSSAARGVSAALGSSGGAPGRQAAPADDRPAGPGSRRSFHRADGRRVGLTVRSSAVAPVPAR
jgi:DNA-binding IclR family transcriptional regulator